MDNFELKTDLISICCTAFGNLKEAESYVPRGFFRKANKTILKEFNLGLKLLKKSVPVHPESASAAAPPADSPASDCKTVTVVTSDVVTSDAFDSDVVDSTSSA